MGTLVGRVAQTMRITHVVVRAMQKANNRPDRRNLCPCRLLNRKMVQWQTAAPRNRTRKTAVIGTSSWTVGTPPNSKAGLGA